MAGADYGEMIYRNGIFQPDATMLGTGRVQARFWTYFPDILLDGKSVNPTDVKQWLTYQDTDEDGCIWTNTNDSEYQATLLGHHFQARHVGGNMLDMELIEPDGTIWQGRGGYHIGRAFLEVDDTPERFYQRLMGYRFQWTPMTPE